MLRRARARWRDATLLCITHDVSDTMDFERVLVIDGARLVEDGSPSELAANEASMYRRMLDAETTVHRTLWSSPAWRRLRLDHGKLEERFAEGTFRAAAAVNGHPAVHASRGETGAAVFDGRVQSVGKNMIQVPDGLVKGGSANASAGEREAM
jgi:ABC-type multidrug transport system ATPase subunit